MLLMKMEENSWKPVLFFEKIDLELFIVQLLRDSY